jgi:SAM-dependent methyltransferase
MTFHDHFSDHAADYARFRPRYPDALFTELAALCEEHRHAWDCATGSGQAAIGLTAHFEHVTATDASPQQLAQAAAHPRVAYRVAAADASGLPDHSIDLVTVAQALHWFDTASFFAEVRRVLKPRGVLAVWCYGLSQIETRIDAVVARFYDDIVGPCWPPARTLVEEGYQSLAFPFPELPKPILAMTQDLTLDGLLNYLGTWSATKRFEQQNGHSPIPALEQELLPLWGDREQPRRIIWPLTVRVFRAEA